MISAVGVIPARYKSSRLPGKLLADLQGKPLIYHVFRRASRAGTLRQIFVATDDERIATVARNFGATVVMTRSGHSSGTDRIAEAMEHIPAEIVVNIQGDEPLIDFVAIDQVVGLLQEDSSADMATLMSEIVGEEELWNPNVVKVVPDERNVVLYFSRSPVPFIRDSDFPRASLEESLARKPELLGNFFRHIGLYAFRRNFLMKMAGWPPSRLEKMEGLEQLRALEHGAKIKVGLSLSPTVGVDTPEDLDRIRRLVKNDPKILEA